MQSYAKQLLFYWFFITANLKGFSSLFQKALVADPFPLLPSEFNVKKNGTLCNPLFTCINAEYLVIECLCLQL